LRAPNQELARRHSVSEKLQREEQMAANKPTGDNARKGAVRKRSQLKTKVEGESRWTKRDRASGEFMAQTKTKKKFKGVRREKPKAETRKAKAR
jgi:hypothetical protein